MNIKTISILIMLNNYFHDFAAAIFVASAAMLYVFGSLAGRGGADSPAAARFFLRSYQKLRLLIIVSVLWIIAGGVVRTVAYKKYEWMPAAGRGQVPTLIFKHILIFIAVAFGAWFWIKLRQVIAGLKESAEGSGTE